MTDHDPLCFCDEFGVCICKELERRDARVRREVLADLRAKADECSTVGDVLALIDGGGSE